MNASGAVESRARVCREQLVRLLDLGNRWHGAGSHHDAAVSDSVDGNASCWQADREHRREAYSAERRRSEAHRTDNRQRSNDARKPHECDEVVEVEVERVGLRGEGVTPPKVPRMAAVAG